MIGFVGLPKGNPWYPDVNPQVVGFSTWAPRPRVRPAGAASRSLKKGGPTSNVAHQLVGQNVHFRGFDGI